MNCDIALCDTNGPPGAFSPSLCASQPTGGTEMHLTQLAEGFARAGHHVVASSHLPQGEVSDHDTGRVEYVPANRIGKLTCKFLVTCNLGPFPAHVTCDRAVTLFTHLPKPNLPYMAHLRHSDIVCVSKWQAAEFPYGWRTRAIRPIVDDSIYALPRVEKNPGKFVCASAWWKGGVDTLVVWEQVRRPGQTLYIGSPYSHPPDLRARVERVPGCVYLDLTSPRSVVEALRDAAGVFRVSAAPETAGVTDAIARILGCRVHVWAMGGVGALHETLGDLPSVTSDRGQFEREFHATQPSHYDGFTWNRTNMQDYGAAGVVREWIRMAEL